MKQLLQEIINYLATRPYQEVYQLINKVLPELQRLQQSEKTAREIIEGAEAGEQIAKRENSKKPLNPKAS